MYRGKMTPELEVLYKQYYEMFKIYPYGHEELDYSDDVKGGYQEYVNDIKKALEEKKDLVELFGEDEPDIY